MIRSYFKFRDKFNFSPHRFEIGNLLIQTRHFDLNHLCRKIYQLSESDYPIFYQFHLDFFLQSHPYAQQHFFEYLHRIISNRIHYYEAQNKFSSKQKTYQSNISKLESFQSFLRSIDQWHLCNPLEVVIAEKNRQLEVLTAEITKLKEDNSALKRLEPQEYIHICKNHLGTFIDLIHQIQSLRTEDDNLLVKSQNKSTWYKLIARYFRLEGKPISFETVRNYFTGNDSDISIKGTKVKKNHKLFKINKI